MIVSTSGSVKCTQFLTGVDVWLTPTMSAPPALIGEITSTADEPLRALERGGPTVAYAGVVANITGSPAMSVPLWQNTSGLPIGVHSLGRYGDEATLFRLASQLESARPWSERIPPVVTQRSRWAGLCPVRARTGWTRRAGIHPDLRG
jgi:amidase